jgi:hypothetical protein
MRFLELTYDGNSIIDNNKIHNILEKENLDWLFYADIQDAKIEIKNHTLIWHSGYFHGNWQYGIFKDGQFHGKFQNGILEGGNFKGEFISGINLISV